MMKVQKWYMIATISGKEQSVIDSLKYRKEKEKIQEFTDFYVAMAPHLTPSKKRRVKNLYPGYIFIKMIMTDQIWLIIRNTEDVTGLIGSSGQRTKPTPVSMKQMENMWNRVKKIEKDLSSEDGESAAINFKVGDQVVITRGEMSGMKGPVLNINARSNKTTIEIEFFGKKVETEVPLRYVEKIERF